MPGRRKSSSSTIAKAKKPAKRGATQVQLSTAQAKKSQKTKPIETKAKKSQKTKTIETQASKPAENESSQPIEPADSQDVEVDEVVVHQRDPPVDEIEIIARNEVMMNAVMSSSDNESGNPPENTFTILGMKNSIFETPNGKKYKKMKLRRFGTPRDIFKVSVFGYQLLDKYLPMNHKYMITEGIVSKEYNGQVFHSLYLNRFFKVFDNITELLACKLMCSDDEYE